MKFANRTSTKNISLWGVAAILGCLLSGCGGDSVDCDPEKPREYAVTNYSVKTVVYADPIDADTAFKNPTDVSSAVDLDWARFSLEVNAATQIYFVKREPVPRMTLFSSAMACSPSPETASQKLTKVSITSDNTFAEGYPAGSELSELFAPVRSDGTFETMAGFDDANLPAPRLLRVHLLTPPQAARQNFTLTLSLDDGNIFVLESGDIYFVIAPENE